MKSRFSIGDIIKNEKTGTFHVIIGVNAVSIEDAILYTIKPPTMGDYLMWDMFFESSQIADGMSLILRL